jgi:ABC-type amino acid transport substrate-binding protein
MVNLSIPWRAKKERFQKYFMVGLLTSSPTPFLVKKGSKIQYIKLEDLKKYTIGTILGFAYPKSFEEATFLKKSPIAGENTQLLKKLIKSRVDLVICDRTVFFALARKANFKTK